MTSSFFADTSVAVPLVLFSHEAHRLTNRVVGRRVLHLTGHAAVESYSVLTRLPGDSRLAAIDAITLLRDRFRPSPSPVAPPFPDAIGRLADVGVVGGAVYDGMVALALVDDPQAVILSRDLRAAATYARLGVRVELIAADR